jgi:hypothetical protein
MLRVVPLLRGGSFFDAKLREIKDFDTRRRPRFSIAPPHAAVCIQLKDLA